MRICTFHLSMVMLLQLFSLIKISSATNNYCKINCGTKLHTLCKYGNPCYNTCPYARGFRLLDDKQRESILHKHNEFRNLIASGAETHRNFADIKVSNMNILSWNKEAEYIASCVARRCESRGAETCNDLLYNASMKCGQNTWNSIERIRPGYQIKFLQPDVFNSSIEEWYATIKHCGCNYKKYKFVSRSEKTKFSQIVWGKTIFVGCAYLDFIYSTNQYADLICNYCPEGLIEGKPYFAVGKIGPNCGTQKRYPYLCGTQRSSDEDPYVIDCTRSYLASDSSTTFTAIVVLILYY